MAFPRYIVPAPGRDAVAGWRSDALPAQEYRARASPTASTVASATARR